MARNTFAMVLGLALAGIPAWAQPVLAGEGHEWEPAFLDGGVGVWGNLGFAPQQDKAVQLLMQARGGSFLGVGVREIDSKRAAELKLKDEHGVEITSIEADSPAQKAGLTSDDVVLEYNGQRVEGIEQFVRLVRETPPGRTAKLLISRHGSTQTVAATIAQRTGKRPALGMGMMTVEPHLWSADIPRPAVSWRSTVLGVDAEKVEGQLAQFFGVREGVLVRAVGEGSAAQKAGLKAGDVITKVGDVVVDSPRALSEAVRSARGKGTVALTMTRDRKESAVTIPLSEQGGTRPDRGPARSVRNREF